MIAAAIMGRKGSKGFPGKNLHVILGHPLAYYPMKAAKDCPEIDRVYLSTDDDKLMEIARSLDIEIIVRPQELCSDGALGEDVYVHALKVIEERNANDNVELVVLLMCNAVTVTPGSISEGIKVLREHEDYDSAVTVSKYNMWSPIRARKIGEDGLLHPFVPFEVMGDPKMFTCDRDSQGDVWFADMGVSVVRPDCLRNIENGLLPQKWMGRRIYPIKQWGGLDVDEEWQIPQVEYWLKSHLNDFEK
ncbi:MAG: hypothetical protein KA807_03985 [Prolixibacteraceae bacterium]|nr:hypothetical protein [Prolixibacteraceae bacterium]